MGFCRRNGASPGTVRAIDYSGCYLDSAAIHGQTSGRIKDAIYSFAAGIIALGLFYLAIFAVHFCYVTPKRAWVGLNDKLRGRSHRTLLKDIIDETIWVEGSGNPKVFVGGSYQYTRPLIIRLIARSDDFEDESDLEAVCDLLEKNGHGNPFLGLECKYGESLKGKKLKLLQDARVSDHDLSDEDDVSKYVAEIWEHANGLKKVPASDLFEKH